MGKEWEKVADYTYRMEVPGGWLYGYSFPTGASITFVPWPDRDGMLVEVAEDPFEG